MKNILLKFDDKRFEFLESITPSFRGKQNTDRVNYALDLIPVYEKQLQASISLSNDWEKKARQRKFKINELKQNLNEIKHALKVLQVFVNSNKDEV